jgi:hypothetical protein
MTCMEYKAPRQVDLHAPIPHKCLPRNCLQPFSSSSPPATIPFSHKRTFQAVPSSSTLLRVSFHFKAACSTHIICFNHTPFLPKTVPLDNGAIVATVKRMEGAMGMPRWRSLSRGYVTWHPLYSSFCCPFSCHTYGLEAGVQCWEHDKVFGQVFRPIRFPKSTSPPALNISFFPTASLSSTTACRPAFPTAVVILLRLVVALAH